MLEAGDDQPDARSPSSASQRLVPRLLGRQERGLSDHPLSWSTPSARPHRRTDATRSMRVPITR
jgi:hypothetical protein